MTRQEELKRILQSLHKELNDLRGDINANRGKIFSDDRMEKALNKEQELIRINFLYKDYALKNTVH